MELSLECNNMCAHVRTCKTIQITIPYDAIFESSNVLVNAEVVRRHLDRNVAVKRSIHQYHFELFNKLMPTPGLEITFNMPFEWRLGKGFIERRTHMKLYVNQDGSFVMQASVQSNRAKEARSWMGTLNAQETFQIEKFALWRGLTMLANACED